MDELVRWLGEQLDRDERIARAADDSLGKVNLDWVYQPEDPTGGKVVSARGYDLIPDVPAGLGAHVAEYDPRRVLGEIDAKRRTLIRCQEAMLAANPMLVHFATQTVWEMARSYAGRPGYREEWRP
ncbi:DUF6221 family protein [Streptomyces sp. SCL15-4]|uniref:DUF6221 family protein n=1 Tax=Streptomyces sp. SCL15-4 TaxID=2967221 RepID=UPI0029672897|nr:DUF6221 family protein [Streptomyces sp. SCL15-4]